MPLRFFCALLAGVFITAVSSRADVIDNLEECYGERLDVVFPAYTSVDLGPIPETRLSLPSPNAWLIATRGNVILQDLPCQPEPVAISRATVMGIHPRLGHVAIPAGDIEGARVQMIRLSHPSPVKLRASAEWHAENVLGETEDAGGGFRRRAGTNTDAIGGSWFFPEDYLSPFGNRIKMGCAVTCSVSYGLHSECILGVSYRLLVEDTSRQPDWIGIDQAIRKLVISWMAVA